MQGTNQRGAPLRLTNGDFSNRRDNMWKCGGAGTCGCLETGEGIGINNSRYIEIKTWSHDVDELTTVIGHIGQETLLVTRVSGRDGGAESDGALVGMTESKGTVVGASPLQHLEMPSVGR